MHAQILSSNGKKKKRETGSMYVSIDMHCILSWSRFHHSPALLPSPFLSGVGLANGGARLDRLAIRRNLVRLYYWQISPLMIDCCVCCVLLAALASSSIGGRMLPILRKDLSILKMVVKRIKSLVSKRCIPSMIACMVVRHSPHRLSMQGGANLTGFGIQDQEYEVQF